MNVPHVLFVFKPSKRRRGVRRGVEERGLRGKGRRGRSRIRKESCVKSVERKLFGSEWKGVSKSRNQVVQNLKRVVKEV